MRSDNVIWAKCFKCNKEPSNYPVCIAVTWLNMQWSRIEELQCYFLDWMEMSGFVLVTEKGLHLIEPFDILPEEMLHKIELMKKHGYTKAVYDELTQRYADYLYRVRERLIANAPKLLADRQKKLERAVPIPLTAK